MDVLVSGYAFRLKILHERGLSLVKRQGKSLTIVELRLHSYRLVSDFVFFSLDAL